MQLTPKTAVRLKNTSLTYTVIRTYKTHADDPKWEEEWAELMTHDGQTAYWKVSQLEEVR